MGIEELIRIEDDGTLSFGNYGLDDKKKRADFDFQGDKYKIKTFSGITKLERNGMFVYESTPGTAVFHFKAVENAVAFQVEAAEDVQITLGLEAEQEYTVYVDQVNIGKMKTNLGGKLPISIEINAGLPASVKVEKN